MIKPGALLSYDTRYDIGTNHRYELSDKYIWQELSDGSIICTDTNYNSGRSGNIVRVYRDEKVCFIGGVVDIDNSTVITVNDNTVLMECFNGEKRVSINYSFDVNSDYLQYLQYRYLSLELRGFLRKISRLDKVSAFDIVASRSKKCIYIYGKYKNLGSNYNSNTLESYSAKQAIKFQNDSWELLSPEEGNGISDIVDSADIVVPQVLDYLNTTRFRLVDEDSVNCYVVDISDGVVEKSPKTEYSKLEQMGIHVATEWGHLK